MSIRLMTEVWRMDLPATDKMVLLALADSANDDGVTWIALKSRRDDGFDLTIKCSLSKRAIQLAIRRLEELGLLHRVERPGRGVIYTVLPGAPDAPVHKVRPAPDAPAGAPDAPKPSTPTTTEAKASVQRVFDRWNEVAKAAGYHTARVLDHSRTQTVLRRIKEHGEATLLDAIDRAGRATWLKGQGRDTNWRPDFDWFLTPAALRKLLEGSYGQTGDEPLDSKWTPERRAALLAANDGSAASVGAHVSAIVAGLGGAGLRGSA